MERNSGTKAFSKVTKDCPKKLPKTLRWMTGGDGLDRCVNSTVAHTSLQRPGKSQRHFNLGVTCAHVLKSALCVYVAKIRYTREGPENNVEAAVI